MSAYAPVLPTGVLLSLRAPHPPARSCCRLPATLAPIILALLAGCSAYSPSALQPGATLAEVVSVMGPPTGSAQAPRRLEFARGPYGKHTYMVDFDADGRLLSWEQVLTENNFFQVQIGETKEAVVERLGRPSSTFPIGRQRIVVWNYRYETPFCQWFQVSIGTAPASLGRVTDVGFGPDPMCTSRD